jgi:hypothetical protein
MTDQQSRALGSQLLGPFVDGEKLVDAMPEMIDPVPGCPAFVCRP